MPDLNSLLTSKLAFGVLIGSLVATGGTAMAAFAGALPEPLQQTAHTLMGAPEPGVGLTDDELTGGELTDDELTDDDTNDDGTDADGTGDVDGDATGPDVTGSAAFGLCTAYTKGGLAENSTAYRAFDDVEGGIDAYCDTVIRDKSDKSDRWKKPDKSQKVTGPKDTRDAGTEEPADAPTGGGDAPADGSGENPADTPEAPTAPEPPAESSETAPEQQKVAPEAGKPAKELPAHSNGNGGKDG